MKKALLTTALTLGLTIGFGAAAEASTTHTVQSGDSFWKIGQEHNISYDSIMQANHTTSTLIHPGDVLTIPGSSSAPAVSEAKAPVAKAQPKAEKKVATSAHSSDVDLLARIVHAEALGEPYSGKVAVAEVVLNRVASSQFPNSIQGVIYDPGQFSPVSNGSINRAADAESVRAAKQALAGSNIVGDALFFYNPSIVSSSWFESKPTSASIGHHVFKK